LLHGGLPYWRRWCLVLSVCHRERDGSGSASSSWAELRVALRCGRPGYNCARSSILWGTFAAGPCCPALHSRGCKTGRRDCVTAPASSWPSSRRDGGRSCLHAATRTPPAAGTAPRRGLAMHMHGCAAYWSVLRGPLSAPHDGPVASR